MNKQSFPTLTIHSLAAGPLPEQSTHYIVLLTDSKCMDTVVLVWTLMQTPSRDTLCVFSSM